MFMVYWSIIDNDRLLPQSHAFSSGDMAAAMHFMEQLRIRHRQGEAIRFITMCSENPQSVGPAGVADPSPEYNWKKRRR